MDIYLASRSPRRAALLQLLPVHFSLLLPDDQEDAEALEAVHPAESPAHYVRRVVEAKAGAALARMRQRALPPLPILAADTTVALGSRIFGKPADKADALRMLRMLAGRRHRVLTGVACIRPGGSLKLRIQVSTVWFARIGEAALQAYVDRGESMDKAGGYAIQGSAALFVRRIEGSQSGIMGLPLYETALVLGLRQSLYGGAQTPHRKGPPPGALPDADAIQDTASGHA